MLRDKYAAPGTPTFVELEFEVRGQRRTVRRNPEYLRPKARGEGFTTEKADACLTYADGRPPVTRAKDVTAAVVDIIGLDYNQFSQIAMIAQGSSPGCSTLPPRSGARSSASCSAPSPTSGSRSGCRPRTPPSPASGRSRASASGSCSPA